MIDSIKQLLQQEAQAVLNIPVTDAYEKAVKLIVEQIHQKKGKLVTSGMGKAGQIAMNIATTFCSTGIPSVFLHPSEAQHGDLGILQKNDLLLLISNSGKTREIVELTRLAHNLDPDLKFIVITGNPDVASGSLCRRYIQHHSARSGKLKIRVIFHPGIHLHDRLGYDSHA